jgi:hypothetical protein
MSGGESAFVSLLRLFSDPLGLPLFGASTSESESFGLAFRPPAKARGGGAVPGGGSSSV